MMHLNKNAILSACLTLLLSVGCGHREKEFRLEGRLRNLQGNVFCMFGTEHPFDRIDTVRLRKGEFAYVTHLDTVKLLTLLYNEGEMLPIFADKGIKVTIEGDASHPDSICIRGGALNEELNGFNAKIRPLTDQQQIFDQVDSFITTHPFSEVSVYLLNKYYIQSSRPDYKRAKDLIATMSGMLQDHPLIQLLEERMDNAIKSDSGRYVSNFRMRNWAGANISSQTFRNKVVVVLFWASWDEPSVKLYNELMTMQKEVYKKEDDIAFIYVSIDADSDEWAAAVQGDSLTGNQVREREGWRSTQLKFFGAEKLPTLVLLTPQRRVATRNVTDLDELSVRIDSLLKIEKDRQKKLMKK